MTTPLKMKTLKEIMEEAKAILDDKHRGLKPGSNTNKSRYALLACLEEAYEAGKWIPLYEKEAHSWREEFDEEFVEHSPMANWVDTENGEKGKCLDDLIAFISKVEKQARKDEREKVVPECMYIATEALANGGDLDTVLDGMKTLLNKLSNNN